MKTFDAGKPKKRNQTTRQKNKPGLGRLLMIALVGGSAISPTPGPKSSGSNRIPNFDERMDDDGLLRDAGNGYVNEMTPHNP